MDPTEKSSDVVIVPQSEIRRQARRRRSPRRRSKWYERENVQKVGSGHSPRREVTKIVCLHDLVRNNGMVDPSREGQVAMVVSVEPQRQVVTVAGPDGLVDWIYKEIDRIAEGRRSDTETV